MKLIKTLTKIAAVCLGFYLLVEVVLEIIGAAVFVGSAFFTALFMAFLGL